MMFFTALMPSITGISTSMVTTSGLSSATMATASLPFAAEPTTSIPGSEEIISLILLRKKLESSTIRTLIAIATLLLINLFIHYALQQFLSLH